MADIMAGLEDLATAIRARGIRSIALPALGANLGGLDWSQVREQIRDALGSIPDLYAVIFEPGSFTTDGRPNPSTNVPTVTKGRAALVLLMQRYINAMLDTSVTLLEVHKLLYFLQAAGEPLRLRFHKAIYGPYAENLRHVLKDIEGHLIQGYRSDGDNPWQELALVPGAVDDAEPVVTEHPAMSKRLNRVMELVAGFESAFGLELLSTVHWVANEEPPTREKDEIVRRTYAWNERKKQFKEPELIIALETLRQQGWLPTPAA